MDNKNAVNPSYDRRRDDPWRQEIRKDIVDRHEANTKRLDALEGRVGAVEGGLAANTRLTESVKLDTASLVAATRAARAVRMGLAGLGRAGIFISPLIAAACAVFSAFVAYLMMKK